MRFQKVKQRTVLFITGLLVLFTPVLLLAVTLGFLRYTEGLESGEITVFELVELYAIEVVVVGGFALVIYKLTIYLVVHHQPEAKNGAADRELPESNTKR